MSKTKVQKLRSAYRCGFLRCALLPSICILLWGFYVSGLRHCASTHYDFLIVQPEKLQYVFVSTGRAVGMPEWWGGRAGTIYSVCAGCLKKLQNTLVSLICRSDTQCSSVGNLVYSCLNDNQTSLRYLISERLIQMGPIWHMLIRFAHCLRRFAFKVSTVLFFGTFEGPVYEHIAPEQISRGVVYTFQTHCLNANATIRKLDL